MLAWSVVGLVVVIVAVLVIVNVTGGHPKTPSTYGPATAQDLKALTGNALSVFNTVGAPSGTTLQYTKQAFHTLPAKVPPLSLVSGPLPEVFYLGAEDCPFCAATRWGLIMALSRFGTFSRLGRMTSSAVDRYPLTNTFTFYGSTYSSHYLDFVPVEMSTNQPCTTGASNCAVDGYVKLQSMTPAESRIAGKYDAPPYTGPATSGNSGGAVPFVDFNGKLILSGAPYDPGILAGMTWPEIDSAITSGNSTIAPVIIGVANSFSAAICATTGDRPASVCNSSGVTAAAKAIGVK